jgi:UDP-N-acetylmuramate dehydrogenase
MAIRDNVNLADYSTMRLGGAAAHLVEIHEPTELVEALSWAQAHNLPVIVIGGGSNLIWRDEGFPGLVVINKISRFEQVDKDELNTYLTIGAGERWDSAVERSVQAGLTGIEALSLIPGSAGATPVQNVGAYGQEISQTLISVEAFDVQAGDFVTIAGADCGFGYRTSRFKTVDRGRFYITALTLHLTKAQPQPPFYSAVAQYFLEHQISDVTPAALRQAVIAIRSAKLPDPAVINNTGSFFGNPVITADRLAQLQTDIDTEIPHWPAGEGKAKISAAWLIEQAGFKDFHDPDTGMATWPRQSLVIINEHAQNTAQLLAFAQKIITAVQAEFGITLEQEPELLP